MKKRMLRTFSVILGISILLSSLSLAFAQTTNPHSETPPEDCFLVLNCSSDEEIYEIFSQIEENNRIANEKWQEALAESQLENGLEMNSVVAPQALISGIASADKPIFITLTDICSVIAYATYKKADNGTHYTFAEINSVTLTNKNSTSSVQNITIDYTPIDRSKTLAVNYAFKAGAKKSNGDWIYEIVQLYCEFYASTDTGKIF